MRMRRALHRAVCGEPAIPTFLMDMGCGQISFPPHPLLLRWWQPFLLTRPYILPGWTWSLCVPLSQGTQEAQRSRVPSLALLALLCDFVSSFAEQLPSEADSPLLGLLVPLPAPQRPYSSTPSPSRSCPSSSPTKPGISSVCEARSFLSH